MWWSPPLGPSLKPDHVLFRTRLRLYVLEQCLACGKQQRQIYVHFFDDWILECWANPVFRDPSPSQLKRVNWNNNLLFWKSSPIYNNINVMYSVCSALENRQIGRVKADLLFPMTKCWDRRRADVAGSISRSRGPRLAISKANERTKLQAREGKSTEIVIEGNVFLLFMATWLFLSFFSIYISGYLGVTGRGAQKQW